MHFPEPKEAPGCGFVITTANGHHVAGELMSCRSHGLPAISVSPGLIQVKQALHPFGYSLSETQTKRGGCYVDSGSYSRDHRISQ